MASMRSTNGALSKSLLGLAAKPKAKTLMDAKSRLRTPKNGVLQLITSDTTALKFFNEDLPIHYAQIQSYAYNFKSNFYSLI